MARKAMNDVAGPRGLPPTMLVYGTMPRARGAGLYFALPKNDARFKAVGAARSECIRIVIAYRVHRLLQTKVHAACDRFLSQGDSAFVWMEKIYKRPYNVIPIQYRKSFSHTVWGAKSLSVLDIHVLSMHVPKIFIRKPGLCAPSAA